MYLIYDICGRTTWHVAAKKGKLDILHMLCEWVKEVLTPEELNNKIFVATDIKKKTAWHRASEKAN